MHPKFQSQVLLCLLRCYRGNGYIPGKRLRPLPHRHAPSQFPVFLLRVYLEFLWPSEGDLLLITEPHDYRSFGLIATSIYRAALVAVIRWWLPLLAWICFFKDWYAFFCRRVHMPWCLFIMVTLSISFITHALMVISLLVSVAKALELIKDFTMMLCKCGFNL